MLDLSKHHAVGNASPISHDHQRWLPFLEFDNGKQEQVDREKAQVNRSLERLYFAPIQLIWLRLFVGPMHDDGQLLVRLSAQPLADTEPLRP